MSLLLTLMLTLMLLLMMMLWRCRTRAARVVLVVVSTGR
jgi:hypothetical protein